MFFFFSTKAYVLNPVVSKEIQMYFPVAKFIVPSIINIDPQFIELNENKNFKFLLGEVIK